LKKLHVALPQREYDILVGDGLLAQAGGLIRGVARGGKLAVVTDSHVRALYGGRLSKSVSDAGLEVRLIEVPAGESSKSVSMLEDLYDAFMDFGLTRTDAVAALGGGVVGDLAGFAAATILRGVDFVQIPTTLLSQVDSSVGGKVAVNLKAGKKPRRRVLAAEACSHRFPLPADASRAFPLRRDGGGRQIRRHSRRGAF
jgi:3-dehydroquinate synthase